MGQSILRIAAAAGKAPALFVLLALAAPPTHSAEPLVDPAWLKANPGTPGVRVREDMS